MILCQINDRKDFMQKLLNSGCFDSFLLREATIKTAASYTIDGLVNHDFYSKEELENPSVYRYPYLEWNQIRPLCYHLIKGKRTPVSFRFLFYLKPELSQKILKTSYDTPQNTLVRHMVLNIKFEHSLLSVISGIAYASFTLEKEADKIWDTALVKFLEDQQISFSVSS